MKPLEKNNKQLTALTITVIISKYIAVNHKINTMAHTDYDQEEREQIYQDFTEAVNMTSSELEK